MLWFAIIISIVYGIGIGLITRSLSRALRAGLIALGLGIIVTFVIIYSGIMGG
jgi:hypothetical protein